MEDMVIVIGGNHHNTLGLVRGLGRKGLRITVILHGGNEDSYVLKSRYISDSVLVNSEEEIVNALLQLKVEGKKWVVACASDYSSSVVDKHRSKLIDYFYLPGSEEEGKITRLMDKETMAELAVKCGLRVPESVVLECGTTDYSLVPFPCITKPIASIAGSKADIKVCRNEKELGLYLKQGKALRIQAQRFVSKTMEYQLIGVVKGDEVLIPGRSRILTQPSTTNTGYLHYEHLDGSEPLAQCKKFLKETGYSGLFSIEFIRDEEGKDYFMEINFRNDGNAICVTDAGVNLPYQWFCLNTIENYSLSDVPSIDGEIYVLPEYTEVELWYKSRITFSRMVREFRQADTYMEYAADDPKPTNGRRDLRLLLIKKAAKKPLRALFKRDKK